MSKVTPAAFRLSAVLELLARDPARSWSLIEIASELEISRSTCHSMLVSLDQVDLVYRNSAKRYSLGSMAANIGRAAMEYHLEADMVRHELEAISREFGLVSVTNYRRKDFILVRDCVDPLQPRRKPKVVGRTIPLSPPWGAVFLAWESVAVQRRWMSTAPAVVSDPALLHYIDNGLREIRRRKYLCGVTAQNGPLKFLDLRGRDAQQRADPFFHDLHAEDDYAVAFFAAPVLDVEGRTLLAISLTGIGSTMRGAEIQEMGEVLAARCRKLGSSLAN